MSGTRFITFEGVDGCGKSTQLKLAQAWLEKCGMPVVSTREPGDTPLGGEIRSLLLDGKFMPSAECELLMFLADRAQHVREVIAPALQRGEWVLCDRFSDSTMAYQLAARRLAGASGTLRELLTFAECGVQPDMTLWFDLSVDQAMRRMQQRVQAGEKSTRLDDEATSFHAHVAEAFRQQWEADRERIRCIDASPIPEDIHMEVRRLITEQWPEVKA
ncbi:MAG TPA: dTMP kinase [Mariprofundaceae bacterium]|nr:dTMP kinase [Mariprofundaceae bacterium]